MLPPKEYADTKLPNEQVKSAPDPEQVSVEFKKIYDITPGFPPTVGAVQQSVIVVVVEGLHCVILVGAPKAAPNASDDIAIESKNVATKDIATIVNSLDPTKCNFNTEKYKKTTYKIFLKLGEDTNYVDMIHLRLFLKEFFI